MARAFYLSQLEGAYAVCRLAPDSAIPAWAAGPGLWCTTKTHEELSIVCLADRVPADLSVSLQASRDWACFWLHGPFDFAETGVLAALLNPLAEAGIGIFALSTYDTDYLLVKQAHAESAARIWRAAGHLLDSIA